MTHPFPLLSCLCLATVLLLPSPSDAVMGSVPCSEGNTVPYWDHLSCDAMAVVVDARVEPGPAVLENGAGWVRTHILVGEVLWGAMPSFVDAKSWGGVSSALVTKPVAACFRKTEQGWETLSLFRLSDPRDPPYCSLEIMRKWGSIARRMREATNPELAAGVLLDSLALLPPGYRADFLARTYAPPVSPDRDLITSQFVQYLARGELRAEFGVRFLRTLYLLERSASHPFDPDRRALADWLLKLFETADVAGCCAASESLKELFANPKLPKALWWSCHLDQGKKQDLAPESLCSSLAGRLAGVAAWNEAIQHKLR